MSYILSIETATKYCGVALSKNGQVLVKKESNEDQYRHAELVHPFMEEVMQKSQVPLSELSAVSVSIGPGSYTGLRIGVSAAKGLCYALNIPIIGIDTLEIIARQISLEKAENIQENSIIVPVIDARRMEVYTAWFDNHLTCIKKVHAAIIEDQTINKWNKPDLVIGGDGAEKLQAILPKAHILNTILPDVNSQAIIAYERLSNHKTDSVAYLEPYYHKDFIAGKPKPLI